MTTASSSPTILTAGILIAAAELDAREDVTIDGRFNGRISMPEHQLTVGSSGAVDAKIVARTVIVFGRLSGTVIASERVELLAHASVEGHITTPSLLLVDGACFTGTIDPERSQAGVLVAQYRDRKAAVGVAP